MGTFDRQIATAKRLITKYGAPMTWRVMVDGAPVDPDMPWKPTEATTTEYPVHIVMLPETRIGYEWVRYLVGTEIPEGSGYGLMYAVPFIPSLKDTVIAPDGSEMKPSTIDPLQPNLTEIIMYTLRFQQ